MVVVADCIPLVSYFNRSQGKVIALNLLMYLSSFIFANWAAACLCWLWCSVCLNMTVTCNLAPEISTLRPLEQVWYSGRRLTYTCMASVGSKEWYINRVYASHEKFRGEPYKALVSLSQDGRTSYLSVEASPATNNSEVICRLYNPPNADEMNRDVISVQGMDRIILQD